MRQLHKMIAGALVGAMLMTTPAMADWTNTDKGPGVAQWLDESGNVAEPPAAEQKQGSGGNSGGPGEAAISRQAAAEVVAAAEEAAAAVQRAAEEKAAGLAAEEAQRAADEAAAAEAAAAAQRAAEEAAARRAAASGRTIDPNKPMVALTFDDGPQTEVDNRLLDCLAQYGGKATFFMVGDRVASRKAVVQRMAAEGHEVANHTLNHKYLHKQGAAEIQRQVQRCNDEIFAACGVRPTVMRLPGGNYNATVLANTNMPMIQWSIDTLDWKTRNADKTVAAVVGKVKDGDIVLMHDLYSQTGDAALRIIPALVAQGYQLVTVSELAAAKGKTLQAGQLYSAIR